jgi:hypothetical protein
MNETHSFFSALVFATIGGFGVVVGLLLEFFAEKKTFKSAKIMRCWESAKKWGEWFVIVGVAIEVLDAGFTAHEVWQIKKDNPKEQVINSLQVNCFIEVKGTNTEQNWNAAYSGEMKLITFLELLNHKGEMVVLSCSDFEKLIIRDGSIPPYPPSETTYEMSFKWPFPNWFSTHPKDNKNWIESENLKVKDFDNEIKFSNLIFPGLKDGNKILSYSCELEINGQFIRKFSAPNSTSGKMSFNISTNN